MKLAFVLSAGALAFRSFVYSAERWRERQAIRRAGGERDSHPGLEAKRAVGNENAADNQAGQRLMYITISLTKVSVAALIRKSWLTRPKTVTETSTLSQGVTETTVRCSSS